MSREAIVAKVTVYRFTKYDISVDNNTKSRRWATREAIERVGGEVLEDTATEVDPVFLGDEIDGMTERNFDPHRRTGFPTQVEVAPRRY
jgi:hypothetical protein